ncbi:MAG: hypothetical protein JJ902_03865 [Roseibium sp.]|nr:hypothetical protein [Roseibium sp.]
MGTMTDQIKDGGPAFPSMPPMLEVQADGEIARVGFEGMSMRDWFAGRIAAAYCADRQQYNALMKDRRDCEPELYVARQAYKQADAMLKARGETQ